MNLRAKIIGGTLLLLLVTGVSTVAVIYTVVSHRLEAELAKRGETITRYVAESSTTPLLTENSVSLQLQLQDLLKDERDISYLFVLDRYGEVFAHTFAKGFPVALKEANAPAGEEKANVALLSFDHTTVYDFALPILGGDVGVVRLGFYSDVVSAAVRNVLGLGASLIGVILLIVGGLAVVFEHQVTGPIISLTRATEAVGEGKMDERVHSGSRDELGSLARGFNAMMERIEKSQEELVQANLELETEIADRREAEARVREREIELKLIFENSPVMTILLDSERKVKKINRAGMRQFARGGKLPADQLIGTVLSCIHALGQPGGCGTTSYCEYCLVRTTLNTSIEQGVTLRQVEVSVPVHGKSGKDVSHLLISSTPLFFAGEKLVLASIEDITKLKRAEIRLQEAYRDLERQNEALRKLDDMKSNLIRDVSHELKTPVAKFFMHLEMIKAALAKTMTADELSGLFKDLERNVLRQEEVIRNILDLNRLESGKRWYLKAPMRLDTLIERVVGEYRSFTDNYGLKVHTSLERIEIESDEAMLWHVLSNLIANAIKFTRHKTNGEIRIGLKRQGGGSVIQVGDNGMGIAEADKPNVFERFFQASASREGIGVGLSICTIIVEGLGGTVELDSDGEGRGATATVFLPDKAADPG